MSGFATDTTIDHLDITLPDERIVRIELQFDGVNEEPYVSAHLVVPNGTTWPAWQDRPLGVEYHREVLIDGITEEDEEE